MECNQTHSVNDMNVVNAQANENNSKYCIDGCMRLAAAILESACSDYVKCLKKIKDTLKIKNPTVKERMMLLQALREKVELEKFYRSERFQIFTLGKCSLSPDQVMKLIRLNHGFDE